MAIQTRIFTHAIKLIAFCLMTMLITSCGGGGGNGSTSSNSSTSSGTSSSGTNGSNSSSGNSGVLQCTLLATGSVFSPAFNDGYIYQIAVDSSNVYWYDVDTSNNTGVIKSVPKAGGAVTILASGLGGVNDFTLDDTSIYWAEHDLVSGSGAIKSVPKSGGTVTILASGFPAGSNYDVFDPFGIVLDNTYVYWGESVGGGAVRRIPKAGGTVIDINRGQGNVGMLALDSPTTPTTIYYSGGNGGMYSIPIAGGNPFPIATNVGTNSVSDFIVDSTTIYGVDTGSLWGAGSNNTGAVYSIPLTGGVPTPLSAMNLQNPKSLVTDGTFLYYEGDYSIPGGPGAIVKVAKTGGTISKGLCDTNAANPTIGTVYNAAKLAVDANSVYMVGFVNGGPGGGPVGILKAPKP